MKKNFTKQHLDELTKRIRVNTLQQVMSALHTQMDCRDADFVDAMLIVHKLIQKESKSGI